ncbi:MAG: hypothetical protein OHK0022_54700 [Roseiflexaceae bacterium]
MIVPTPEEREAFVWMQGRMVELLLRYDAPRFAATFGEQQAARLRLDALRRERELAVLFYLRDELFEAILPRIKRRLSFAAPRELAEEQLPPRGRIDWPRTAAAALRERPGEPPLEVWTRQHRRHFATPENLLTVATLLEYRDAAQRCLDDEAARDGAWALRHPLHAIVEGCTRELAFLQFAGLMREAAAILEGFGATTVEALEQSVADNLLPGRNSAYDDLLAWRRRLRELDLLDRTRDDQALPMLGSDPRRDNYLYQLWLFYELGDLLREGGALHQWDQDRMRLEFTWGAGDAAQRYRLQHDQTISDATAWSGKAPGVRPDLYIERVGRHEVSDGKRLVWREPGYLLDAKYYRPKAAGSEKKPSEPVKRMIADLQLTDERYGALLFAFHGHSPATGANTIRPNPKRAHSVAPDVRVDQWQIRPAPQAGSSEIRARLTAVLERVHAALGQPVAPRCRGVFLDTLGVDAHGRLASAAGLAGRDGAPLPGDLSDLLVCPKPHIGPWRVDLVSLSRDCCQNAAVCHIKHQPGAQPPRRLTAPADLRQALRPDPHEADEPLIAAAEQQATLVLGRYLLLLRPDLRPQHAAIRSLLGLGALFDTSPLLAGPRRDTLAQARLLWEQIEQSGGDNYAGPALLLAGVLEQIVQQTIFQRSPVPPPHTLAALAGSRGDAGRWPALLAAVEGHWHMPSGPRLVPAFADWLDLLPPLCLLRRDAARQERLEQADFQRLCRLLFGDGATCGALNGLLLAWQP